MSIPRPPLKGSEWDRAGWWAAPGVGVHTVSRTLPCGLCPMDWPCRPIIGLVTWSLQFAELPWCTQGQEDSARPHGLGIPGTSWRASVAGRAKGCCGGPQSRLAGQALEGRQTAEGAQPRGGGPHLHTWHGDQAHSVLPLGSKLISPATSAACQTLDLLATQSAQPGCSPSARRGARHGNALPPPFPASRKEPS